MKYLITILLILMLASPAFAGRSYDKKFESLQQQYGDKMNGFDARDESIDQLMNRLIVHFKKLSAKRKRAGHRPVAKQYKTVISTVTPQKNKIKNIGVELKDLDFNIEWE